MSMTGNYDKTNEGTCFWCLRAIKWVPVLFIVAIIVWSYYAYVIQLCFFTVTSIPERIIIIVLYHLVFMMFAWSYWQTVITPIGIVPLKFRIPKNELDILSAAGSQETQKQILEIFAKDLPITNRTTIKSVRYCNKCTVVKPDRAHHCSVCGTCVLKMDHHCPWVNNCVNFSNYKFFVLFLGYSLIYCIYIALTVLRYFIMFWEGKLEGGMGRFHILFLFFVAVMFAISLVSLFGYHIYLTIVNRTTLEAFRAPVFRNGVSDKNGFNLGKYNNFQEVFGDNKKLWFLPVFSSLGDGVEYPVQEKHLLPAYESMGDTPTRLDDNNTNQWDITILNSDNTVSTNIIIDDNGCNHSSSSSSSNSANNINNNNINYNMNNVISNQNVDNVWAAPSSNNKLVLHSSANTNCDNSSKQNADVLLI